MRKFFNKWGSNEEGKGKKAPLRTGEGLVRSADIPAFGRLQQPALLLESGTSENEAPDVPSNRPVPSFISNSANLPSYGQSAAVPLPLPSEPLALPLPAPSSPEFLANQKDNPHSLPTEDSLSPAGLGYTNLSPVRAHNEVDAAEKAKSGLTISRAGPNKTGYTSSRPHQNQKGLVAKSNSKGKGGSQNPIQFNFPNQRPSPLETVLSGPKRGQVSKPIADATASEPSASPAPSELSAGVNTPCSNPEWMSSVPPVSPYRRNSTSPLKQLQNKLRRSPSGSHNPDANPDHSNTSSPLSRFSPVGQANQVAVPPPACGRVGGKSAPSSPARSESPGPSKADAFGSGTSIASATSEPALGTELTDLNAPQPGTLEPNTRMSLEKKRDASLGQRLMAIDQATESGLDDTSEDSSSMAGSESTASSAAGAWFNGSSPSEANNRVHFDLNAPHAEVKSNLGVSQTQFRSSLISPKVAHVLGIGDDVATDLFPQHPKSPEAQRKKEVGEEDLTRSITPRTAEALQGVQRRMSRHGEASQAGASIHLGPRGPQRVAGPPPYRGQRPVSTHLNVPKQLSPITAGPAWHEGIAGLPVLSSEMPSSGPQAHPLPDIEHTYVPPSATPSPTEGVSLPIAPASVARGSVRPYLNRNLASPENHPYQSRASCDGRSHTKSSENVSPGGGKPVRLSEVGGSRTYYNDISSLVSEQSSRPRRHLDSSARGLSSDAAFLPKGDMHHLPLSEATRTLSDPILPRPGQRRPSLDQGSTPLPLPLPPAEQRVVSKGVSPNQGPLSPSGQPSPLPGIPPAGYPMTLNPKQNPLVSPSQTTHSPSPHPSPSSVLQRGDRNSRDFGPPPTPRLPVNWRKGDKLGSGTFGSVFKALNSDTGEMFAVKEVGDAQQNVRDESVSQLEQEISLLSRLKHPNIVQYVGTKRENGNLYIFLEFMPGGSIEYNLRCYGAFPEPLIKAYTKQILCGLKYLHDMSTIHRDIKGANILVDVNGKVKLADFGMAKQICEGSSLAKSGMKGSPYWMAPEVVRHERCGRPADIWSVGCTVLEMADGVPPWSRELLNPIQIIYRIASSKDYPYIPEHLSDTAVDFIKTCLNRFPDQRPGVDELLRHPFIADVAADVAVDIPHTVGPIVPRSLHLTGQSPLTCRPAKPGQRNPMETGESVSATVQALVDAPSPRPRGPKGLEGVGGVSGKNLGGRGRSRPQTPPPNWSPSSSLSDEPRESREPRVSSAKSRLGDSRGSLEQLAKPSLRWKSPPPLQSRVESILADEPSRFTDARSNEKPPLVRHKSADAPLRPPRTRGRVSDDGYIEFGRVREGASASPLEKLAGQDGPQDSNNARIATHKRWLQDEDQPPIH